MMKQYNLFVANYKNWLLNRDIIKLLDLKRVITKGVIHLSKPVSVFESETGFSFGMYVKQTVSIQPVSMDS